MLDALTLASSLYLEQYTGEIAGMHNVILKPSHVIGTRNDLTFSAFPNWHNHFDLSAIYGSAMTGDGPSGTGFQELHGKLTSLYTVYNSNDVLKFNTGIYSLLAYPFHNYRPYTDPATNAEYAAEETEKTSQETLVAWDFDFEVNYDRSVSSLHNVVYLYGKRMGPNLLAYEPVLGFDWHHEIFLAGTKSRPKLSIFGDAQFWFAKKANTALFNAHDGIGATKRELFLGYGVNYFLTPRTSIYLESYGFNNLNRGDSATKPIGFRDGSTFGIRHDF